MKEYSCNTNSNSNPGSSQAQKWDELISFYAQNSRSILNVIPKNEEHWTKSSSRSRSFLDQQ